MQTQDVQAVPLPAPGPCPHCGRDYTLYSDAGKGGCPAVPRLTFRQTQIIRLVQHAKSNKEIAYELQLTVGTVKEYLHTIFRKLGVANRTELALRNPPRLRS